jgi:hypothetical protein
MIEEKFSVGKSNKAFHKFLVSTSFRQLIGFFLCIVLSLLRLTIQDDTRASRDKAQ